jgi:hypothetical protein
MLNNDMELLVLNENVDLDFFNMYNRLYHDNEIDDDPYTGITLSCKFYDINTLHSEPFLVNNSIFISINIQSLYSKFDQLSQEISELESKGVKIDVIALQEIWDVRYPENLLLTGFKPLIFKKRHGMRGGGVGFYIRNHLNAQVIDELSPFENKIIEALTIKMSYPDNKHVLLSSVYRSNGPILNVTQNQQIDTFLNNFSELLQNIQSKKLESYVFIDSNIDLLNLRQQNAVNYLNIILEKSFLQGISKATRIQNNSKSLIDHILFNSNGTDFLSGTIVSDVSDHFFTFIAPPIFRSNLSQKHRSISARNYSLNNLNKFKAELSGMDWTCVLSNNDVDLAYGEFWKKYNSCHDANFPLTKKLFNKNIHKRHPFMTQGLLISRNTKNKLHKKAIAAPSLQNVQTYKRYKTLYFRILRGAKKLHITNKLNANVGNPKKTWETLNEILGKPKKSESVGQININGVPESDPSKIANQFNSFFTSIGKKISNDVPNVNPLPHGGRTYWPITSFHANYSKSAEVKISSKI